MPTVPRGSLCTPGKHQPLPSRLQGGSNTLSDIDLAKAPRARGRIGTKLQDVQGGGLGLGPLCVVGRLRISGWKCFRSEVFPISEALDLNLDFHRFPD